MQKKLEINKVIFDKINVIKVIVYPKKKQWDIYFNYKELLNIGEIHDMGKEFKDLYNLNSVNLLYEAPIDNKELLKIIKSSWEQILAIILLENPGLIGFLNNSLIKYENNNLVIVLNSKNDVDFLKDKNIDIILRKTLTKHYNVNIEGKIVFSHNQDSSDEFDESLLSEERQIIKNALKSAEKAKNSKQSKNNSCVIFGKDLNEKITVSLDDIDEESGLVVVEGDIFYLDFKELNNGNKIISFYITDYNNSLNCKLFLKPTAASKIEKGLVEGIRVKVKGNVQLDSYTKDIVLYPKSIIKILKEERNDNAKEKRVELHAHTNMSAMDGITSATELIKRAKEWGHKAIAITDHGVVQAFPEAYEASLKYGIKVIYGVEGYLANDEVPIIYNSREYTFDEEFVVFDIETTGLSSIKDSITEIGAVIIKNRQIVSKYSTLVNPETPIPKKIVKLTGITDDMVSKERTIKEVLPEFLAFIGKRPVVAHNANFDWGFIKNKSENLGFSVKNTVIDTLELSRNILSIKKHKLNNICDYFNIRLLNHHRALNDAMATAKIFIEMLKLLEEKEIYNVSEINKIIKKADNKYLKTYHVIILVKNAKGLLNLYKLISLSHIEHFYKKPRILRSLLEEHKEGLIVGSACEAGEIFRLILNNSDENTLLKSAKLYDYFEIQPLGNNQFLINNETLTQDLLIEINKKIIALANKMNKPVVATGDVHFLEPVDEVYRRILMAGQGYSDADSQAPLYFKTTDEMLSEFNYLDKDLAYSIVIDNTIEMADAIEDIVPIPLGTFPPKIDGAEEQIKKIVLNRAHSIYGDSLPSIVSERLDKELGSIINNGYAVMYLIAHKLVTKSLNDGYYVGSRGSVGSSFVATMCNITEVNPLPPHYICPNCKYSDFYLNSCVGSGFDLNEKKCPNCETKLIKDGHDIPFEVFLGLEGNKEPDIDLNFAGEYQAEAHKYTEEIFGKDHVFRAGTIGTLQEKTSYGFVKKYYEKKNKNINQAEIKRLIEGCKGVKRTTGQHPGGIMIIPSGYNIYEFTPIQKPADDLCSSVITTHFDYRSISGRLLKLDILGHDVPTIIRMLEDITKYSASRIKFDNKTIMSLFTSTKALNVELNDIECCTGTLGIPEFGTRFVRQMLIDTNPTTFGELVRISGLSHGTDVWLNNAQDLIKKEIATLKEVISTRDDIMLYMIQKGLSPKTAFEIAESVRKGNGLSEKFEKKMKENNVPNWYIDSCKIIKYLFPKAHATAYVMMSFRIAYYKVYYPEAFYATYFTVRIDDFDSDLFIKGKGYLKNKWTELNNKGNNATAKEKGLLTVLEVVYEMYLRGIKLLAVDLYKSAADKFIVTEKGILPPLMSIQGLGVNAAFNIVKERKKCPFISIEDLKNRTKLSKTVVETLKNHKCFEELPESNQLSLF